MKYFKKLDEDNNPLIFGTGDCVPSDAIEITEEEYRQYIPKNIVIDLPEEFEVTS